MERIIRDHSDDTFSNEVFLFIFTCKEKHTVTEKPSTSIPVFLNLVFILKKKLSFKKKDVGHSTKVLTCPVKSVVLFKAWNCTSLHLTFKKVSSKLHLRKPIVAFHNSSFQPVGQGGISRGQLATIYLFTYWLYAKLSYHIAIQAKIIFKLVKNETHYFEVVDSSIKVPHTGI